MIRDPSDYERPHTVEWVSGACFAVRRTVLEQIGGLDESFFHYSEDIDICARIWNAGYEVRYVPDAVAEHEGGASAPRARLLPILAASRIRYAKKHDRPLAAPSFAPASRSARRLTRSSHGARPHAAAICARSAWR